LRKLLIILLLLVGTAAAAVASVPFWVSDEAVREGISGQLSELSGSQVTLGGGVEFAVYPDLGFKAENVAVGASDDPLKVSTRSVIAKADLLSLFSGKIRVTELQLDSPQIIVHESGGATAAENPQDASPAQSEDLFRDLATYLDGVSIDRLAIAGGTVTEISASGSRVLASDLDLELSAPGLDKTLSMTFSGTVDGQKVSFAGELGSLGELLGRQPTFVRVDSQISPPPHPLLAAVNLGGEVQLAADGSYRVHRAKVTMAGQPVNLDVTYSPGKRGHIAANISAGRLVFENAAPASSGEAAASDDTADSGPVDFEFARRMDFDLELQAEAIQTQDAIAEGVFAVASVKNGKLDGVISSQAIAKGSLSTEFSGEFVNNVPEIRGRFTAGSIDLNSLAELAAVSLPVDGIINSDIRFAFRAGNIDKVRNTLNFAGKVGIAQGSAVVPQLASALGSGAEKISGISTTAQIDGIQNPVQVSGSLFWQGEEVGFSAVLPLRDIILGRTAKTRFQLEASRLSGRFDGNLDPGGTVTGDVNLDTPSLSGLLDWLGQENNTAIKRFAYQGNINAKAGSFSTRNARITLDETILRGAASVQFADKTVIQANLSTGLLDLTKLSGGGSAQASSGSSGTAGASGDIDLSALRGLEGEIRLDAEKLRYDEIKAGPVTTVVKLGNNAANVKIPNAGFYGGRLIADVTLNAGGAVPAVAARLNLQNLAALPLLKDASGFERIDGRLNASIDVTSGGRNSDAMTRALAGQAEVQFSDGAIRGIDMAKLIRNLEKVILTGYSENSSERTQFTELAASFAISNGVATTQNLRLLGPLVRMEGAGNVDLGNQTIDMQLNPRVVGSLAGQGGDFDVSGLELPMIVKGPLAKPKIYPDLKAIARNPEATLRSLSKLKGIDKIAKDALNPQAVINKELEKITGSDNSNLVGGLLQTLGNRQTGENSTSTAPNTNTALIGTLLQGALGNNSTGSQQPSQSTVNTPQAEQNSRYDVPVPTRSPRKPASQQAGVPQQAQEPQKPAEQVIENVLRKNLDQNTGDILQGILGNIGN